MSQLGTHLPTGCPVEHVAPLLDQRRDVHAIATLNGTDGYVDLDCDGTQYDRELARAEIRAAMATLGCANHQVAFDDLGDPA